ncbi:MAG: ABC transporter substrate-binding protein [Haloarculaceae archaeon]
MLRRTDSEGGGCRYLSRRQWLAMLGVGGAGSLAGCGALLGGNDGETPDDGTPNETGSGDGGDDLSGDVDELPAVSGTYDTVTSAGFETLNPLYNTSAGAGTAIGRTLDQGYTFDADSEYFPLVYDMSTDGGEVWVFDVREGLEFSDPYGQVDAETFVYQIQQLHQSDWANTASSAEWTDVTVEQTGEYEFQAELPNPQLLWPESFDPLEYPIPVDLVEPYVEEEDVEGLQQDEELLELGFTGNLGQYVLEEWTRGSGVEYTRNGDYYVQDIEEGPELFEGAPYFEGGSISVVEEQASRLGALQTGEADAAGIPPERFAEFDDNSDVDVLQIPQPFNEILSVNMRDNGWNAGPGNLFRVVEFRQALACAINKEELIAGIFRGLAEPHFTWQPRFSRFYPGDDAVRQFGVGDLYGREVARDFAGEALEGFEFDYRFDGDALIGPDGDQVALDLYHSAGQETEQLAAEFIAQELGENLGIDVAIEAIDGTRFAQEFWRATPPEDPPEDPDLGESWAVSPNNPGPRQVTSNEVWDMSLVFGLNTFPMNPLTNTTFFDGPDAFYNPVGYYPEFDAEGLWQDAREATSVDQLEDILEEFFVQIAEEQPYIFLVFTDSLVGYNPDLVGPIENFHNGWNQPAWHFEG